MNTVCDRVTEGAIDAGKSAKSTRTLGRCYSHPLQAQSSFNHKAATTLATNRRRTSDRRRWSRYRESVLCCRRWRKLERDEERCRCIDRADEWLVDGLSCSWAFCTHYRIITNIHVRKHGVLRVDESMSPARTLKTPQAARTVAVKEPMFAVVWMFPYLDAEISHENAVGGLDYLDSPAHHHLPSHPQHRHGHLRHESFAWGVAPGQAQSLS